ncbi:PDR/VanB family oxidoreductase [Sodalis sp. RH16]|uniref:PDR/VanB family oxidoreductase n=1 Tax=Sodalis sp. RH16 TaxID=3394331 RepID=UPI0039B6E235
MEKLAVFVDALSRQGEHCIAVRLTPEPGKSLPAWEAGAHIDLHLANGLIRQYSLTGPPGETDHYLICVKNERDSRGGSRYLHNELRLGQQMEISPPRNLFPLEEADSYLLIAGGIGLTPLLAMAEELERLKQPFELHYYVKRRSHVIFRERLDSHFAYGRCHVGSGCEGRSPRTALPEGLAQPAAGKKLYLCGPEAFMSHIRNRALDAGWRSEDIHSESFQPRARNIPCTQIEHDFTVTLKSSGMSFTVPPDKTIAAVLQEHGVDVPLSCEMGICGACLTPVLEGKADHRDTVQSETEKAGHKQQITLCCSRSLTGNLVIDL